MKILVVDDSKLARISLIKAIKKIEPSAEFFEATDGVSAIEFFEKEKPRIVFLDLTMPRMNGYEALKKIMAIEPNTQVIIVTADIQPTAKTRVLDDGAKYMCSKPITDEKILDIFNNHITI